MEVFLDTCATPTVRYLLVIFLCVLKAAADCPEPKGSNTTVLTDKARLLNDFPDGTQVSLECVNGHVKEKGSEFITCMDGKWSEPDLTCKKKDCGPPEPRPHMSFNISAGTLFGDKIRAICDKGYQIRGPSYMTCYSSGWAGKPRCEMVTCEKPTEVINGRNSWNSRDDPQYGEMINFSCNEGYTLVGKATIVCSETGEYDSPPPTCEGAITEQMVTTTVVTPSNPATTVQETSTSSDSSTTPTAHEDKIIPTPTVSLSSQGETTEDIFATTILPHAAPTTPAQETSTSSDSSTTPTAKEDKIITTPTVSSSSQGATTEHISTTTEVTHSNPATTVQQTSTSSDTSTTPTAHEDKTIPTPTVSRSSQGETTENIITTTMVKHSTPTTPAQETSTSLESSATSTIPTVSPSYQADCPKPEGGKTTVLTNEALLINDYPDGTQVRLECVNGHVKEKGSEFITCMDGKWSESDLTCKKKDCGPPEPRPHMSFNISAGTLFGDIIRAICDKGYQIRGPSYKTCYSSGWTGNPSCEIVTCAKPAEVTSGKSRWDSKDKPKYGEIIYYSCDEGYTLVGKATIVCSETGEYDSPPPKCEGATTEDIFTTIMVTHSTPATPVQDKLEEAVDINLDIGKELMIVCMICFLSVSCIMVAFLQRLLLIRKCSANGTLPLC